MNTQQCSQLPEISFSAWLRWSDKATLPDRNKPGVYLIGRFANCPPAGTADSSGDYVVYIGEASKSLMARWRAFDKAAFGPLTGKKRAAETHGRLGPTTRDEFYLATMPSSPLQWNDQDEQAMAAQLGKPLPLVRQFRKEQESNVPARDKINGPLNKAWIMYVERKLILDFVLKWKRLPVCNNV